MSFLLLNAIGHKYKARVGGKDLSISLNFLQLKLDAQHGVELAVFLGGNEIRVTYRRMRKCTLSALEQRSRKAHLHVVFSIFIFTYLQDADPWWRCWEQSERCQTREKMLLNNLNRPRVCPSFFKSKKLTRWLVFWRRYAWTSAPSFSWSIS